MEKEKEKDNDTFHLNQLLKLHPEDMELKQLVEKYRAKPKEIKGSTSKLPKIPSIVSVYKAVPTSSSAHIMSKINIANGIKLKENMNVKNRIKFNRNETLILSFINLFEQTLLAESPLLPEDYLVILFFTALTDTDDNAWYQKMLEE